MTESTEAPTRTRALSLDDWTTAHGDPPPEALEPVCRVTLSKTAPRLFSYSRPSDRWGFFIVEPAVVITIVCHGERRDHAHRLPDR